MKTKSYNVCCICTGNACRSPFCETVLKALLQDAPELNIAVCSRGTLNWGENPRDVQMAATAQAMGYTMEGTTTCMTYEDLKKSDLIVVFSQEHRNRVTRVLDYANWDRIVLFDQLAFGQDAEVEDPHFQSEAVYCRVAKHIEEGCRNIVEQWKKCPPASRDN